MESELGALLIKLDRVLDAAIRCAGQIDPLGGNLREAKHSLGRYHQQALAAPAVDGWMTMESAPKDGTAVLVSDGDEVSAASREWNEWQACDSYSEEVEWYRIDRASTIEHFLAMIDERNARIQSLEEQVWLLGGLPFTVEEDQMKLF